MQTAASRVQREGDIVWIDGVQGFSPGDFASSVHGADARILELLGEPLSYDDLLGYSAFAFRVGVHDQMCPSAGHPWCGFACVAGAVRTLPWRLRVFNGRPWEAAKTDEATFQADVRAAVRDSIDRGIPVHYGSEEDGLILGYSDGGARWLCLHPYHKGGRETFWYDEGSGMAGGANWPWGIAIWVEPKPADERVAPKELLLAGLRQAVEMGSTEKVGDYFCGAAAYDHWLSWLRGVESGAVAEPKAGMQGNGWGFDVLIHSRRIAGRWLSGQAELLAGEAAEALRTAAAEYDAMAAELLAGYDCPWNLALGPNRCDDWTSELRQDQIARLEAAKGRDAAAIAAIKTALARA